MLGFPSDFIYPPNRGLWWISYIPPNHKLKGISGLMDIQLIPWDISKAYPFLQWAPAAESWRVKFFVVLFNRGNGQRPMVLVTGGILQ